ncbi:hypothetical protein [Nonomuraea zeae]|uniref:hypothetical protein n=1 Tax=Nonomuraea zeae TaxID=1642303 RepID=UPI001478D766|nr:hypothetical protein [Nonomuraea zeae]
MTVTGVVVLLLNDHLLKQVWPGFVTGKLSDVAGLVVAPALLALLFRRRADLAATVLTGVAFALVKCTETGAEAATQAWTLVAGPSRVLADPTDLLALPALALAWWVRRRTLETSSPAPETSGGGRRPSRSLGTFPARWRILVTMPMAVLAVTATSAAPPPPHAESVEVDKAGRIIVHVQNGSSPAWISEDGGHTWTEGQHEQVKSPQSAACVPGQATRCYRAARDHLGVEQSDDGGVTWGPSWPLSGDDRERLVRQHGDRADLRSVALAVQARPGGHTVVVANREDGILVRDPSGAWRRVGWPGDGAHAGEADLTPEMDLALFLAVSVMFGGIGAGLRRHHALYTGFAAAAATGFYLTLAGWHTLFGAGLSMFALGGLMVVAGVVGCFVLMIVGRTEPLPVAVGVLGAPLVYATVYTPFYGWSTGTPGSYQVAVALAVALTALVLLAGIMLIRRDARQTDPHATHEQATEGPT